MTNEEYVAVAAEAILLHWDDGTGRVPRDPERLIAQAEDLARAALSAVKHGELREAAEEATRISMATSGAGDQATRLDDIYRVLVAALSLSPRQEGEK